MEVNAINHASREEALSLFLQCCTSRNWADLMVSSMPFKSVEELHRIADQHWAGLSDRDYLEAFEGHPKIGDVSSLKEKYRHTKALAVGEQSLVDEASDEDILALSSGNAAYENKFGFIFIVCATGKSAAEMLFLLKDRLLNDYQTELKNAAEEQRKIFHIRLEKLL